MTKNEIVALIFSASIAIILTLIINGETVLKCIIERFKKKENRPIERGDIFVYRSSYFRNYNMCLFVDYVLSDNNYFRVHFYRIDVDCRKKDLVRHMLLMKIKGVCDPFVTFQSEATMTKEEIEKAGFKRI